MTGLTVATIFGAPLATFLGQTLGWRETYLAMSGIGLLAFLAILRLVPSTRALDGVPLVQELSALTSGAVWMTLLAASIGVGAIFAVYTFIVPLFTDLAGLSPRMIPAALALFGIGMTLGNVLGGRIADRNPSRGLILGFGSAAVVLAVLGLGGASPIVLFPALFAVGATTMAAIPAIQVRLTRLAPAAPSLVGAINLAALNTANAVGAFAAATGVEAGYGLLSAAWAGALLSVTGLLVFAIAVRLQGHS